MLITDISNIDRQQWQQLVCESPVATWFQTPEAYDFFASLPQMMTPFVVAVSRQQSAVINTSFNNTSFNNTSFINTSFINTSFNNPSFINPSFINSSFIRGLVLGYVTREKNPIKQFFTRRAIIYGGPLLAEDITDEELHELLLALKDRLSTFDFRHLTKPIYIETRNFNDYSRWRKVFEQCGFAYQPHYDMHIDCSDAEQMAQRINDGKQRQIRKAISEGVEIVEARTKEDIEEFYRLLKKLYSQKIHKPLFPLDFFTNFVTLNRGVLLLAKMPSADSPQSPEIIGGMLCPLLEGKVIYEWYVVGSAIVTWAAMDYANKHGIPLFDLMGAGEPNKPYGVRDFKLQFGGEVKEYGRYLKINNALLFNIGKIGVKLL